VKKSCLVAALVAALAAAVAWMDVAGDRVAAQSPPAYRPAAPSAPIAVVDVAYIFKMHPRFKAQEEEMRAEVARAGQEFRKEREALNKLAEKLQGFAVGSLEYKGTEEELLRKQSDLQARGQLAQKEFQQRDAKIHYGIYQEILQEVQYYCQANGIAMVVNFNGEKVNPDVPDDVLRGIRQNVVYSHKDLDITPYILRRLAPAPAPADLRGGTPAPMGVAPLR